MACGLQVRKHDVFAFGYLTEESLENGEVNYRKKKKKKVRDMSLDKKLCDINTNIGQISNNKSLI